MLKSRNGIGRETKKNIKGKDRLRKKKSREKFKKEFALLHEAKGKKEFAKRKERRHTKIESMEPMVVNMQFPSFACNIN